MTKKELFRTICNASRLGTLGFFIGTGFTKAVIGDYSRYGSYDWKELLEACCDQFKVEKKVMENYCSYPELATKICKKMTENAPDMTYDDAVKAFKAKVCELTRAYPDKDKVSKYADFFEKLSPSWITTTNYDTVIECILGGRALPISPDGCFRTIKGMTPVYHLHGICSRPEDIVITNEDYTHLFRPGDYRQARLPFLMKESCVLMLGYALGDINVISAVDWVSNVYTNVHDRYDLPPIQILYNKEGANPEPYEKNGMIIYEISDLGAFFEELCSFLDGEYNREYEEKAEVAKKYIEFFNITQYDPEYKKEHAFIDNDNGCRDKILEYYKTLEPEFGYMYNSLYPFMGAVMSVLDVMSAPKGEFKPYDYKLHIIMDFLINIPVKSMPPSFFEMLASELDDVGRYVDPEGREIPGKGYDASKRWKSDKDLIPVDAKEELSRILKAGRNSYIYLKKLLNTIIW